MAIALSLVWLAATSLHVYLHGVSYFNEWIGEPAQGWKYVADSNLDWGLEYFRRRVPDARAGSSILIYDVK